MDTSKQIEYILENFRFDRVETAMRALDWKWSVSEGGYRVPTLAEIEDSARRLLEMLKDEGPKDHILSYSTGGFVATRVPSGLIELAFVIEERVGLDETNED